MTMDQIKLGVINDAIEALRHQLAVCTSADDADAILALAHLLLCIILGLPDTFEALTHIRKAGDDLLPEQPITHAVVKEIMRIREQADELYSELERE